MLSETTQIYLKTVATTVTSERLFSIAGQTLTKERNRLEGKLVSNLAFLHSVDDSM